jgi:hypothetical protein
VTQSVVGERVKAAEHDHFVAVEEEGRDDEAKL